MEEYISRRIRSVKFLPTFPRIVGEVMSIIEDPKSSAADLAQHMDPSMVGEVLKVANSAYFGTKNFRNIQTVERAVAVVGYEAVAHMVLQMPFLSMIHGQDTLFDRKGFCRHSVTTAIMGKTVSSAFHMGNPHEVYISGMLHDIGTIIIYQHFKEEWHEISRIMEEEGRSRMEAERHVFQADHAYIAAVLLEVWDIPETIVESVRLHHQRDKIEGDGNEYVTWLANQMAKQIDFEHDLADFDTFFKKQRDFLQVEVPGKYLLSHQMELFERAYLQLEESERLLKEDKD
jgi:HD-like signal output (HDOD) protein